MCCAQNALASARVAVHMPARAACGRVFKRPYSACTALFERRKISMKRNNFCLQRPWPPSPSLCSFVRPLQLERVEKKHAK